MPIANHEIAHYRLELQGQLDRSWAEEFAGLAIEHSRCADGGIVTVMSGQLADQAALAGVINLAYELGMPILSVLNLGTDDCHAGAGR